MSTDRRVEAGPLERRDDRLAAEAPPRAPALVEPLADPRLHQDAAGRRLDQQAVERLEEAVLLVELVGDEPVPQHARRRPEDGAGVGAEGARLDERDARPAAEVGRPVDRVVEPHRGQPLARAASAGRRSRGGRPRPSAGSGPGTSSRAPSVPYGRSTGLDIRKKLIWPIRIPA